MHLCFAAFATSCMCWFLTNAGLVISSNTNSNVEDALREKMPRLHLASMSEADDLPLKAVASFQIAYEIPVTTFLGKEVLM